MDEHPKSLTNKKMLVLMIPVCIVIGGFYFVMFGGLIDIMPKDPRAGVATGVTEIEVTAQKLNLGGTVLVGRGQTIAATDVATGKTREVLKGNFDEYVRGLAGPNKNGLVIASFSTALGMGTRLVLLHLKTGATRDLLFQPDNAMRDTALGETLAIADEADFALYFVGVDKEQLDDPQALYSRGTLRLRNLSTGAETTVTDRALDSEFAISEDAKNVWYCGTYDRTKATALTGVSEYSDGDGPVPVIYELQSGASEPFLGGSKVRWLGKESPLKVFTWQHEAAFDRVTKLMTGSGNWPSYLSDVRRILPSGVVIATAKQAKVEDVKFDNRSGMSGGPQPMQRIVAVSESTKQMHTIVKYIDSTSVWSYGTYERPENTAAQQR